MTPFTKYFCTKGYVTNRGKLPINTIAYFIVYAALARFTLSIRASAFSLLLFSTSSFSAFWFRINTFRSASCSGSRALSEM